MKKVLALCFVFIFSFTLSACGGRDKAPFDTLAQCMSDKGFVMYGSDSCPHCKQQKKLFKGSFDLIEYIECDKEAKKCQDAGISAYPTWEVEKQKYVGRKSMSELAELSGCPLRNEKKMEMGEEKADEGEEEAGEENTEEAAE